MIGNCDDDSAVWIDIDVNSTVCLCPTTSFSHQLDLAASVTCFTSLAFVTAFVLFVAIKTVTEAKTTKRNLRRQSELEADAMLPPRQFSRCHSSSLAHTLTQSERDLMQPHGSHRRESEVPVSPRTNLTTDNVHELYADILPQYVITTIDEEDNVNDEPEKEIHVDAAKDEVSPEASHAVVHSQAHNRLRLESERSVSVSSEYNADRLFRMIFHRPKDDDPTTTRGSDQEEDVTLRSANSKTMTMELVTSALDTFHRVRHSILPRTSLDQRQQATTSNLADLFRKKNSDSGDVSGSSVINDLRKDSNGSTSAKQRILRVGISGSFKKKSMSLLRSKAFLRSTSVDEEKIHVILRRQDSVSSCHAPIGPAEAKLIRMRQRRRVAVSFHERDPDHPEEGP